jgi:hypothetical protein
MVSDVISIVGLRDVYETPSEGLLLATCFHTCDVNYGNTQVTCHVGVPSCGQRHRNVFIVLLLTRTIANTTVKSFPRLASMRLVSGLITPTSRTLLQDHLPAHKRKTRHESDSLSQQGLTARHRKPH